MTFHNIQYTLPDEFCGKAASETDVVPIVYQMVI